MILSLVLVLIASLLIAYTLFLIYFLAAEKIFKRKINFQKTLFYFTIVGIVLFVCVIISVLKENYY